MCGMFLAVVTPLSVFLRKKEPVEAVEAAAAAVEAAAAANMQHMKRAASHHRREQQTKPKEEIFELPGQLLLELSSLGPGVAAAGAILSQGGEISISIEIIHLIIFIHSVIHVRVNMFRFYSLVCP